MGRQCIKTEAHLIINPKFVTTVSYKFIIDPRIILKWLLNHNELFKITILVSFLIIVVFGMLME